ncbi:hypothetical protein V6Z12_D09G209600 [Gossypium hirsutum]
MDDTSMGTKLTPKGWQEFKVLNLYYEQVIATLGD